MFYYSPHVLYWFIRITKGIKPVVTQIKVKEDETTTFPAVTLCFNDYTPSLFSAASIFTPLNLNDVLGDCYFEEPAKKFLPSDFENFLITNPSYGDYINCHKFNGGKNATGHETPLLRSIKFGIYSGLTIIPKMSNLGLLYSYIGDNHVKPTTTVRKISIQKHRISNNKFL